MEQHVKRLGNARSRHRIALDNSFVSLGTANGIVGLDGQNLLKHVAGAEGLKSSNLHLSETLSTELRLTSKRLLCDERVGTD